MSEAYTVPVSKINLKLINLGTTVINPIILNLPQNYSVLHRVLSYLVIPKLHCKN